MFLHLSVSHSVHRAQVGVWQTTPLGADTPQTPPWADIPLGRHPPGRHPPPGRLPPPTATAADYWIPTEMISCWDTGKRHI